MLAARGPMVGICGKRRWVWGAGGRETWIVVPSDMSEGDVSEGDMSECGTPDDLLRQEIWSLDALDLYAIAGINFESEPASPQEKGVQPTGLASRR